MIKRLISIIVLAAFLNSLFGCTSTTSFTVEEIKLPPEGKIIKVVLHSGEVVEFDENGGRLDNDKRVVRGYVDDDTMYGKVIEIKYTDIKEMRFRKVEEGRTILLVVAITVTVAAIAVILAIKDAFRRTSN